MEINTLKRLRGERGMKIKELAKQSGVSIATISAIENNKRKAQIATLGNLARALDVPLNALLEFLDTGGPDRGRIRHL